MPKSALVIAVTSIAILYFPLTGCGSSLPPALTTASLKSTAAPASPVNGVPPAYNGTPVALYTLIARGVNSCWLGPDRPLYATHLFRASVSSRNKAKKPSIVIYERDKSAKPEKRIAAMRINITSISPDQSGIDVINRRFSSSTAQQMTADVQRWASGRLKCADKQRTAQAPNVVAAQKEKK